MTVATSELPASPAAKPPHASRDANPASAADTADAATLFLGLLAQATATVAPVTVVAPYGGATTRVATAEDEPSVDGSVPFMAMLQPPPILELELPPAGGGEGGPGALQTKTGSTLQLQSLVIGDLLQPQSRASGNLPQPQQLVLDDRLQPRSVMIDNLLAPPQRGIDELQPPPQLVIDELQPQPQLVIDELQPQPRPVVDDLPLQALVMDDLLQPQPLADTGHETAASTTDAPVSVATPVGPRVESSGVTQTIVRHVPVAVGEPRWAEHVGHEIRLLVDRGVQGATLRLTPEHLGPVEVRIDIVNDKANVVFGAAQAETRAALVEAIPRLREMFASAGLLLGDAGVRQDAPGHFPGASPRWAGAEAFGDAAAGEADPAAQAVRLGLVDAYA